MTETTGINTDELAIAYNRIRHYQGLLVEETRRRNAAEAELKMIRQDPDQAQWKTVNRFRRSEEAHRFAGTTGLPSYRLLWTEERGYEVQVPVVPGTF
jgi:hypothetical protein